MRKASLVVDWIDQNQIFDKFHPRNRDGVFTPYILLREFFLRHGVELNTSDVNKGMPVIFEIHHDVQEFISSESPAYLFLSETPAIRPKNQKDFYLE